MIKMVILDQSQNCSFFSAEIIECKICTPYELSIVYNIIDSGKTMNNIYIFCFQFNLIYVLKALQENLKCLYKEIMNKFNFK